MFKRRVYSGFIGSTSLHSPEKRLAVKGSTNHPSVTDYLVLSSDRSFSFPVGFVQFKPLSYVESIIFFN